MAVTTKVDLESSEMEVDTIAESTEEEEEEELESLLGSSNNEKDIYDDNNDDDDDSTTNRTRCTRKYQSIAYLSILLLLGVLLLFFFSSDKFTRLTSKSSSYSSSSLSSSATSWKSILTSNNCKIAYHIHIPKTGGTSIIQALRTFPNFHELPRSERGDFYSANPKYTMKSLQKHVFDTPEYQDFISSKQQQDDPKDLKDPNDTTNTFTTTRTRTTTSPQQIITSAEKGIHTLEAINYPDFSNTCFFGTVRNPYEWVLSAENHMRTVSDYTGGISGNGGYFNRPNIQSYMMGYISKKKKKKEVLKKEHDQPMEHDQPSYRTCMFTIDHVPEVLGHLWEMNVYDGTTAPILPDCNVRKHDHTITPELDQVIQDKYDVDLELWKEVTNSQNNGILCL